MKNKNKKMIIVVSSLVLVIGVSFAYFMASILLGGSGSSTTGTTATLNNSEIRVEGTLEFNDLDIYPGHQTISSIKVTATGDNELVPYNLIWQGTNTINTPLNYTVYKTSSEVEVSINCNKTRGVVDGAYRYYEECSESNMDALGTEVSSGTINANETKVELVSDEFVTATNDGLTMYYYVVLEYPNLDESQNIDIGGSFTGEVTVELSDTEPDINIIAAYIKQEDGSYKQVEDIPQSGYVLNTEKSTCSNGANPSWTNGGLFVSNLTKSGTSCYLYFDRSAADVILANSTRGSGTPNFANTSCSNGTNNGSNCDEATVGLYEGEENGETIYYFRGDVDDNWVSFAGFYWRIIRTNSDGSIRMIYAGTDPNTTTGESTQVEAYLFNASHNASYYVGLKYSNNQHGITTNSNIMDALNGWYSNNLANYADKLTSGTGFCNDRVSYSNTNGTIPLWSATESTLYYAAYVRLVTNAMPTLDCDIESDNFTTIESNIGNKALQYPIGLITADEASLAGAAYNKANYSYYLYTNRDYLTMTPSYFQSGTANNGNAIVFYVGASGPLGNSLVYTVGNGVRPVINLRADVTLSGSGTSSDPYVVSLTN